jgi:hypothetical protein
MGGRKKLIMRIAGKNFYGLASLPPYYIVETPLPVARQQFSERVDFGAFSGYLRRLAEPLMKKHQFVKSDCNCPRRATFFKCKHCGSLEYCGIEEVRHLDAYRATCTHADAPEASPAESFKSKMGGTIDCLAPDYETWDKEQQASEACNT